MIIMIVVLLVLLVIILIYLLVVLHRIRSEGKKSLHSRIVVSDGNVVTHAAADKNELTYGENQYNNTILFGEYTSEITGGLYTLNLRQEQTGYNNRLELKDSVIVGRDETRYGQYHVDGQGISRRHCRFFLSGGQLYVEDLGSSNGTRVNGARIYEPVLLQNYDTVTLGNVPYTVSLEMMR